MNDKVAFDQLGKVEQLVNLRPLRDGAGVERWPPLALPPEDFGLGDDDDSHWRCAALVRWKHIAIAAFLFWRRGAPAALFPHGAGAAWLQRKPGAFAKRNPKPFVQSAAKPL